MPINFKTIYLFTLIFFGFYIFFNNISNLNLKKNIIISEPKVEEIQKERETIYPKQQEINFQDDKDDSNNTMDLYNDLLSNYNQQLMSMDNFEKEISEINSDKKNYIHCAGGYRSVISCSILKRNGYESVVDVAGGFSSIRKSNFEILVNE